MTPRVFLILFYTISMHLYAYIFIIFIALISSFISNHLGLFSATIRNTFILVLTSYVLRQNIFCLFLNVKDNFTVSILGLLSIFPHGSF